MSRTIITAVVAVVIVALTAITFIVTSVQFGNENQALADRRLTRAYQVVQRLNQLQGIDVSNKAERLASRAEFVRAIKSTSQGETASQARLGFQKFAADEKTGTVKPDIVALVDANGEVLAMHEVPTVVPKQWKNEAKDEKNPTKIPTILPALNVVLGKRVIISDIWNDGKSVMKVGVAPIIDPEVANPKDPDGVVIIGAIVVAYSQTAKNAQQDRELLGTEIAYYDNKRVVASSFTSGGTGEDTAKAAELSELLSSGKLSENASKQKVTIDGVDYFAAAVKMPRAFTKSLPDEYPAVTAGAVVLAPLEGDKADSMGSLGIKLFVLLLGGGALAIAMLGIYLVHRRLVAQVDQIEQGVTDIINGNLDRTFRPVGDELDGLANGLNVMLARLLGRPEPGDEEFDEEGNPIIPGRVEFEESEEGGRPAPDPDLAALAQESEPDYYKRVFTEYQSARKATGATDDGSFENFIAKLKVNEGKLKAQYGCRAVRFRVVTKDGKVSLKPVPIFA
jgi:hypothetical protein